MRIGFAWLWVGTVALSYIDHTFGQCSEAEGFFLDQSTYALFLFARLYVFSDLVRE